MIDQTQQPTEQTTSAVQNNNPANITMPSSPKITNNMSTVLSPRNSTGKKENIAELLHSYIKQSTSIHRERLQRVEEANQILAKEYRAHEVDLDKTKQKKTEFNKELDAMISMLKEIDKVQAGIMQCQRNGKQIFTLLDQIQKKLNAKLQKKVQKLQKIKKTIRT